ncbi:hypothetical protein DRQ50_12045 [bacterium]|nr:MAG: hypothetical protein DRQ50_12045 [bacterium]
MTVILNYLRVHLEEHVHVRLHIVLGLLLTATFIFNYGTGFHGRVLVAEADLWVKALQYLLFYCLPWYGVLLLQRVMTGSPLPKQRAFWWLSAFALLVLVLNRITMLETRLLVDDLDLSPQVKWYLWKCLVNFTRTLAFVVPLAAVHLIWDRRGSDLYGLAWRHFDWRPYTAMLAIMAVPIAWASFQPTFLHTYPIFRPGQVETQLGWPPVVTYGVHEVCYALRFVGVELFFRGFLVIGLARWLGRDALLPMVFLYAIWHFGKPMPEALGSIFGGYILGVIALSSRCIIGGTLVHMGIALLMNLAAVLHKPPAG